MDIRMRIGARVKAARTQRGLSQADLAELLNRSVDTVSAIERGKSVPNVETLERLARVLDVPLRDFFDFDATSSGKRELAMAEVAAALRAMNDKQLGLCVDLVKAVMRAR